MNIQHNRQPFRGCFTNVSRALQDILSKIVYCRNRTSFENFKLKLCACAQSHALGARTKFQLEILTINVISGIMHFREIILRRLWNYPQVQNALLTNMNITIYSFRYPGS